MTLLDPAQGGGEEEVGAEALRLHEGAVVADDRVEVLVARRIGAAAVVGLADAAGAVDEGLVEAALVRLVGFLVAEVPLAEDAGGVAGGLEDLRQDGGVERHALAFEDRVRDAVLHRVPAGHQGRAGRRAGRADQEAGEASARVVQLVEIRRLDPRMPMPSDRRVALVVGHHQDDVRDGLRPVSRPPECTAS